MLLEFLLWLLMSIITQLVKKTGFDAKIIIGVLSIIVGVAFYFIKYYFPDFIDVAYEKMLGAYAVSQIIYNYVISIWIEGKDDGKILSSKKNK